MVSFLLLILSSLINAFPKPPILPQIQRSINLATATSSGIGASVSIINIYNADGSIIGGEWVIQVSSDAAPSQQGYNIKIDLSSDWGFHETETSFLRLIFHSTTPLPVSDLDAMITFVNNNEWVTVWLEIDNANSQWISPACNGTLGTGDVEACVNQDYCSAAESNSRDVKVRNGHTNGPMQPDNLIYGNSDAWPMVIVLENNPTQDRIFIWVYSTQWTGFSNLCAYNAFTTNSAMEIFIAADDSGEYLSFYKFEIELAYDPPTTNPTPSPTNNPTPSPTNNPTHNPTPSPSKLPTKSTPSPTENTTDNPTLAPTDNPILSPTKNPSDSSTTDRPTTAPSDTPTMEANATIGNPPIIVTQSDGHVMDVTDETEDDNEQVNTEKIKFSMVVVMSIAALALISCIIIFFWILFKLNRRKKSQVTDVVDKIATHVEHVPDSPSTTIRMNTISKISKLVIEDDVNAVSHIMPAETDIFHDSDAILDPVMSHDDIEMTDLLSNGMLTTIRIKQEQAENVEYIPNDEFVVEGDDVYNTAKGSNPQQKEGADVDVDVDGVDDETGTVMEMEMEENDFIWDEYIEKYGNEPKTVSQIQNFVRQSVRFQSLNFNQARDLFNERKGKGKLNSNTAGQL